MGAKLNCLHHNRREGNKASYVMSNLSHNNITFYESEEVKGVRAMKTLISRAEKLYTEKTGQKCQKSFTPYREAVLVVHDHVTAEQMENYRNKVEKLTGWKVAGLWYHRDEGYERLKNIDGEDGVKINYHIHCLFDCQDHESGKIVRPKSRNMFSQMQDVLAECVGMERGYKATETGVEHRTRAENVLNGIDQRIEQSKHKVGAGAKAAAFFGVGELAEVRQEIKKLEKEKEEIKKAAEARLMQKTANHTTEIEQARQSGRNEAVEDIITAARLRWKEKPTPEIIGKRYRELWQKEKEAADLKKKHEQLKEKNAQLQEKVSAAEKVADALKKVVTAVLNYISGKGKWQDLKDSFEGYCYAKQVVWGAELIRENEFGRKGAAADVYLSSFERVNYLFEWEEREGKMNAIEKVAEQLAREPLSEYEAKVIEQIKHPKPAASATIDEELDEDIEDDEEEEVSRGFHR